MNPFGGTLTVLLLLFVGLFFALPFILSYENSQIDASKYASEVSQAKIYALTHINSTTPTIDKQNIILFSCKKYITNTDFDNKCVQDVLDVVMSKD